MNYDKEYIKEKKLGEGTFASVFLSTTISTK